MSISNLYPEVIRGAKSTADSAGVNLKSSLEPLRGRRRNAIIAAIKTVADKGGPKKSVINKK